MQRESMEFDILVIGAGPAGLAAAIRLGQLNQQRQANLKICVLEKGSEIGAHILSGAVFEPRALNELIPDWQASGAPLTTPADQDKFLFLSKNYHWRLPTPFPMKNHGNYIISLDNLCQWLALQAQHLGIEIFCGFTGSQLRFDETGKVTGIITGDVGIDKKGQATSQFQPGIELIAKQTLLAEGCHGSLTKYAMEKFNLRNGKNPQTYALGVKELWEIDPKKHQAGTIIHTIGWPLDYKTYGGSFLYHWDKNRIEVGFVVGLDYQNPYLDPFEELQRFKTHPAVTKIFEDGKRLCYGARALVEGGLQSLPKLTFPGGMLIGDCAGFLNVAKIKGTHTAMKSGMIAADTIFAELNHGIDRELFAYEKNIEQSWIYQELYTARNIRPAFRAGLLPGLAYAAIDTYLLRGKAPWTFKNHADYATLKPAKICKKIIYPKPDGKITFDKLSSVYLANTHYNENQPCHLQLKNPQLAIDVNYQIYASPETHYCPANVYEIIFTDDKPSLQINATNCVQCKTCDIKDPEQNINWVPPEGGDGPEYRDM